MGKRKTPQELMAARNPLIRTPVAPVDIYSQPEKPVNSEPEQPKVTKQKTVPTATAKKVAKEQSERASKPKAQEESDSPYSTYLYRKQVKGIKLRAIEQGIKDKQIVQQAIDEFFEKHPL